MKKKVATVVIASTLLWGSLLTPMPSIHAATTSAEIVYGVNFRTGPSTNSSVIRMLKRGESVDIVEQVNSHWYKVKDAKGKTGYVSTSDKYIKVDEPVKEQIGVIVKGVSFRKGPSTSQARMRYLQKNEQVTILEQVNAYWYKVRDKQGVIGYVSTSSQYISTSTQAQKPTPPPVQPSVPASSQASKIIEAGKKYLGTPYEYGSSRSSTKTFDCSAFVRQAFIDGIGLKLPGDSRSQADYVKKIGKTTTNWRNLQPGDILFFMSYKGTGKNNYTGINKAAERVTHDAIYLGDGKILHTYSVASGGVRIDSIEGKHWEHRFIFGGSAIE